MANIMNDKKYFTFMWTIENASYCLQKKWEEIKSPVFVVDQINKTKWSLQLYPRGEKDGNYISCFLNREHDCLGEDIVDIQYELSLIGIGGMNLTSFESSQYAFCKDEGYGSELFCKREDVFILQRWKFLPNDNLRLRCRIWKMTGDMTNIAQCFARTRIGVEKISYIWKLENLSSFQPEKEHTCPIKTIPDKVLMTVILSLVGGQNGDEIMRFKIAHHDENIKYCSLHLCLIDCNEKRVECYQDEFWFEKPDDAKWFTFPLSRQKLMEKEMLYLPGDVLSLQWEWVFSKGIVSEEIEEVQFGSIVPKPSVVSRNESKKKRLSRFKSL